MLIFNMVNLAKNFNYFGTLDEYMKKFATLTLSLPKHYQNNLEFVLNQEIAIINENYENMSIADSLAYNNYKMPLHPNVLSQPEFQFLPLFQK